jgi:hypothetical protein
MLRGESGIRQRGFEIAGFQTQEGCIAFRELTGETFRILLWQDNMGNKAWAPAA